MGGQQTDTVRIKNQQRKKDNKMSYRINESINKNSLTKNGKKYKQKEKEVIQWLDLNRCFILSNKDGKIVFAINGRACMIYIKETDRVISNQLEAELKNYNDYNIKAKAIYNIYDMDEFLGDIV